MTTPRQNLVEQIKWLREKYGPDNLLAKDFEAQLAAMPKQTESTPDRFVSAGTPQTPPESAESSKAIETTGPRTLTVRGISLRSVDEEGYKKRQNWSVGTFHRMSPNEQLPEESSSAKPKTFNEEAGSALEESMTRRLGIKNE